MKIIKNILIGLGALFGVIVSLLVFLTLESNNFKQEQEDFIETFVREFSQNWEVADVYALFTNDMLSQIENPNGQQALRVFRSLGKLQKLNDLEITNYYTGTTGNTGNFQFKGEFSNGPALVQLVITEKNAIVQVSGFHITPADNTMQRTGNHDA